MIVFYKYYIILFFWLLVKDLINKILKYIYTRVQTCTHKHSFLQSLILGATGVTDGTLLFPRKPLIPSTTLTPFLLLNGKIYEVMMMYLRRKYLKEIQSEMTWNSIISLSLKLIEDVLYKRLIYLVVLWDGNKMVGSCGLTR